VRLHVQGWTPEQAVEWMVREGHQKRVNAEREVKRYTTEPLVLSYWWGKQEVLRLRELYRARAGAAYSLGDFHRRLLELGEPPLPLAERLLLAGRETAPKAGISGARCSGAGCGGGLTRRLPSGHNALRMAAQARPTSFRKRA